jgi:hypothetical protein
MVFANEFWLPHIFTGNEELLQDPKWTLKIAVWWLFVLDIFVSDK